MGIECNQVAKHNKSGTTTVPLFFNIYSDRMESDVIPTKKKSTNSIYTVKDVQDILQISRNTAYKLVTSGAFPVLRIGRNYRIPAEGFDAWLNQ